MAVGFLLAGKFARLDFRVGYSTAPVINSEFGVIIGSYFAGSVESLKLSEDGEGDIVVRVFVRLVSVYCCSVSRADEQRRWREGLERK